MENKTPSHDTSSVTHTVDKFAYKGWMNSDNFFKRAFGVFGYNMLAGCIIQAVIMVIVIFFAAILGGFGALMYN